MDDAAMCVLSQTGACQLLCATVGTCMPPEWNSQIGAYCKRTYIFEFTEPTVGK